MVTKNDIINALIKVGISDTDTVIFHSSLKSFGTVDGGAETVISAIKETLKNGTIVFPTLVSRDFANAYQNWDKDLSPSDVGLITEVFRKCKDTLRGDQATHSVAAWGKYADYITTGHCDGKIRYGVFGTTPFSHTSPWQKMYDMDGKVVLLGVTMVYNTFKHFVEYSFANDILSDLDNNQFYNALSELSSWEDMQKFTAEGCGDFPKGVWFWNSGIKEQDEMLKRGLLKQTKCGDAVITSFSIKEFYDFLYDEFKHNPDKWLSDKAVKWINKYYKN